jgi:FAD synthase
VRAEQRFEGIEALAAQIALDVAAARQALAVRR